MTESIQAWIGFSKRDSEPATGDEIIVPGYLDNPVIPFKCTIGDARQTPDIAFDTHGFTLIEHESAYSDVRDRAILVHGYLDETAEFLKGYMGASLVVPSRHSLLVRYGKRLVGRARPELDFHMIDDRIPASFAHLDFVDELCIDQAAAQCRAQGYADIKYSRMMIVQAWRAVSPPPQDIPLALCDSRTVRKGDYSRRTGELAPHNAGGVAGVTFEIDCVHYDPDQAWYYYPSMTSNELLLFRGFDTAHPVSGRVAHAAFDNRPNEPHANARESIESRYYVYYD